MNSPLYDVATAPWDFGQMAVYIVALVVAIVVLALVRQLRGARPGAARPWPFYALGGTMIIVMLASNAGVARCAVRTYHCLDARTAPDASTFEGTVTRIELVRTSPKSRSWRRQHLQIGEFHFFSNIGRDMSECGFKQSFATTTLSVGETVSGLAGGTTILQLRRTSAQPERKTALTLHP